MHSLINIVSLLDKFAPSDGVFQTPVSGLTVLKSSVPTSRELVLYEPSVCFVVQGTKETRIGGQVYRYDASRYLLGSARLPVIGAVVEASPSKPFICVRIDLDSSVIADVLATTSLDCATKHVGGLEMGLVSDALSDTVARLVNTAQSFDESTHIAPLYQRELIWRLAQSRDVASVFRQMVVSGSRLMRIRKAMAWLESNYEQAVSIDKLAKLANMGTSNFFKHFKTISGETPIRFRNRLRVMHARRMMIVDGSGAAEAGYAVGYNEPAQFSREYARLFGCSPKHDARRFIQLAKEISPDS